jgi:hypothetical protein
MNSYEISKAEVATVDIEKRSTNLKHILYFDERPKRMMRRNRSY